MESIESIFPETKHYHQYQEAAINMLLSKQNCIAIAPTGSGKSLVFQVAAVKMPGTTIVISPLKALMSDQIVELNSRGISAISINGDMTFADQRTALRNLSIQKPKIIYVSPERLQNTLFQVSLVRSRLHVDLVVIDEAHCISDWGFDFRPEYCMIPSFLDFLKKHGENPVVFATTATLNQKALEDICAAFSIPQGNLIKHDQMLRKNLAMNFIEVSEDKHKKDLINEFLTKHQSQKALVYLYSREKCEKLASEFPDSSYFHAGMKTEEKEYTARAFRDGQIKVLFATTAFGLGINIPNIDAVVHHDIPESIEAYYQHIGRGGRNIAKCPKCMCLCLWSEKNFDTRRSWIDREQINEDELKNLVDAYGLVGNAKQLVDLAVDDILIDDRRRLLFRLLERYGVVTTIAELNGYPDSIVFSKPTEIWNNVKTAIGRRRNYSLAVRKSGYSIEEIVGHIYEQENLGNIKKMPAMERILVVQCNMESMNDIPFDDIINDAKNLSNYKHQQLCQFLSVCQSKDRELIISKLLTHSI